MALPKPTKNKAPASVQPAGGWPVTNVSDPCCVPAAAGAFDPLLTASGSDDPLAGAAQNTLGQIKTPTHH